MTHGRTIGRIVLAWLGLALVTAASPAFAFLMIDWGSCRQEVAYDREYMELYFTGREICDLVDIGPGFIFRPEPRGTPMVRICETQAAKVNRALFAAEKRLQKAECARAIDGTTHGALNTLSTVILYTQYTPCAGAPPKPNSAARADAGAGPNTWIEFFNPFFGSLSRFVVLKKLNDDDLRRQLIVLHEIAHATGREMRDDDASEEALNERILRECFTMLEQDRPSFASVDPNGIGTYPDATTASNDANDGVLGDDGSGAPPVADIFIADPLGETSPPPDDGGDDLPRTPLLQ